MPGPNKAEHHMRRYERQIKQQKCLAGGLLLEERMFCIADVRSGQLPTEKALAIHQKRTGQAGLPFS